MNSKTRKLTPREAVVWDAVYVQAVVKLFVEDNRPLSELDEVLKDARRIADEAVRYVREVRE